MDCRLLHPWDFPGENTGVGCHFLLQGIFLTQGLNSGLLYYKQTLYHLSHQGVQFSSVAQSCPTLCNPIDYTAHGTVQARILEWVAFPFPTQGSNPGLPHCRWILYQLSHQGSPRILEWVAYPFFWGSSRPRNQTRVSCIAGRFFTS